MGSLADSELVDLLQRSAAVTANECGAVAANQRIGYGFVTARAIKLDARTDCFLSHY